MKGNELLIMMELIDSTYIEAAEKVPQKRTVRWIRLAALAASSCVIIGSAILWRRGIGYPDDPLRRHEIGADGTNAAMEWVEIGQTEIVTEPYRVPENTEKAILNEKPMISGFGEMGVNVDMSVSNGGVWYSQALEAAMDHYGDTVNYRVLLELFCDGVQIASGGGQAVAEAERLKEMGYTVAMETTKEMQSDGEVAEVYVHYYFTIHGTYEQMRQFQPNEGLGYKFMLYDEVLGGSMNDEIVNYNRTCS